MSDQNTILLMCGLETTAADLEKLTKAIRAINQDLDPGKKPERAEKRLEQINELMIKEELGEVMWSRQKIKISLEASANRVAADFIIPYPPGIPLLVPGSLITETLIKQIRKLSQAGVAMVGLDSDEKLLVIEDRI
jgi:arginine/lysine/ornithine decarboxylase